MPIVPIHPARPNPPSRTRLVPDAAALPVTPTSFLEAPERGRPHDYEVGYGKPPRHSRFKPGQSGNPKGRRKGAKSFNTIVREALLKPITVRTAAGTKKITSAEALVLKAIESGTKGDLRAIDKLLGWYATAIPTERVEPVHVGPIEATSATDEATLAELRAMIAQDIDRESGRELRQ